MNFTKKNRLGTSRCVFWNAYFDELFRIFDLVFGMISYCIMILTDDLNEETLSTWLADHTMKRATSSKSIKHIKGHHDRRFTGLDYVFRDLWENRRSKVWSESGLEYLVGTCTPEQNVIVKDIMHVVLPLSRQKQPRNTALSPVNVLIVMLLTILRQNLSSSAFFIK